MTNYLVTNRDGQLLGISDIAGPETKGPIWDTISNRYHYTELPDNEVKNIETLLNAFERERQELHIKDLVIFNIH